MVLLHGGGTSYLGVLPTAKKIAEKYHVVLLAYDGFNPSEPETVFQSLAYEAQGLGHGGLIGENTECFIEEVNAVHLQSKGKTEKRV